MTKRMIVLCSHQSIFNTMNDFIYHNEKTLTKVVRKSRIVYTDNMVVKFRTRISRDDNDSDIISEQEFIKKYCNKPKNRREDKHGRK